MDLSPQAWTAIWATVAFVAVFAVLCFAFPAWEAIRAGQYRRESKRLGAAESTIDPGTPPAGHRLERRSPFARLRERREQTLRRREWNRG